MIAALLVIGLAFVWLGYETNWLTIQLPYGKVILTTKNSQYNDEQSESSAECDTKVEADCKIALNTKYLIALLSQCGDNIVDARLTTPSSPVVFNIGSDRQWTVTPMFVQW